MKEQRISVRSRYLSVDARASKDARHWVDIKAEDISTGGMSFTACEAFPEGSEIVLEGTSSYIAKSEDISCRAKVIFCRDEANGKFLHGVKFIDLDHSHAVELSILIEQMVAKYPELLIE
ncbi:MAG: PilZ domain-containing protein [Defluviitaleaceae bacterium]|nr:PilZ domain-containing protein [Defluviitaleaceae bacterium]